MELYCQRVQPISFNGWRACHSTETIFERSCDFGAASWVDLWSFWSGTEFETQGRGFYYWNFSSWAVTVVARCLPALQPHASFACESQRQSAAVQRFQPVREVSAGGRQWISFRRCPTWRSNGYICYNSIISAYEQVGQWTQALSLFVGNVPCPIETRHLHLQFEHECLCKGGPVAANIELFWGIAVCAEFGLTCLAKVLP